MINRVVVSIVSPLGLFQRADENYWPRDILDPPTAGFKPGRYVRDACYAVAPLRAGPVAPRVSCRLACRHSLEMPEIQWEQMQHTRHERGA